MGQFEAPYKKMISGVQGQGRPPFSAAHVTSGADKDKISCNLIGCQEKACPLGVRRPSGALRGPAGQTKWAVRATQNVTVVGDSRILWRTERA